MTRWVKILVICIIYLCKGSTKSTSSQTSDEHTPYFTVANDDCMSWECMIAVTWIGSNMNSSVDPCDDFYEFSCGRCRECSPLFPQYRGDVYTNAKEELTVRLHNVINSIDETESPKHFRMVKILYENCLASDEVEYTNKDFFDWLEKLHKPTGWPILVGDRWDSSSINKGYIMSYLIGIKVYADTINPAKGIAWIEAKSHILDRAVLRMGFDNKIVQAYYNYMQEMAEILGASQLAIESELKEALITEIMLANDTLPETNRWKMADKYDRTTVSEFVAKYPYMRAFIHFRGPQNYKFNDSNVIMVEKSFAHIDKVVSQTPYRTLANLVQWYKASKEIQKLEALRSKYYNFKNLIEKNSKPPSKWQKCVQLVRTQLGLSLSVLYQRRYIGRKMANDINQMVDLIHRNMYRNINQVKWLDGEFRTKILKKIEDITGRVGFSNEYDDDTKLQQFYKDLELSKGDVEDSLRNISAFSKNMENDLKSWCAVGDMKLPDAFYNSKSNKFRVTSVYTLGEYYDYHRPTYLNYATLGFVIAHEIAHSMDDDSITLAAESNYHAEWWSPEKKEMYNQSLQCVIYQYGNYTVDEDGLKLRAYRTLNENIADNLAANAAYHAYLEWSSQNEQESQLPGLNYTLHQTFWITMANAWCTNYKNLQLMNTVLSNDHSPAKYRVNGAFINRPEFAKDFNCELGTRMNSVKKCSVW